MGNPNYQIELPPVLDENNQPLTVEGAEASLRLPWQIPVVIERNGSRRTHTVLVDLNNIDGSAIDAHEVYKNEMYALTVAESARRTRNSKLTNLKEDEDDDTPRVSGQVAIQTAKKRPQERAVFLNLLFPKDWQENPVVLASNLPDMPTEPAELKAWFERGGIVACEVMDAIVQVIDPTGPLAQTKRQQAQAREMEGKMMSLLEEKLEEIQNLSLVPTVPTLTEVPSSGETEAESLDTTPSENSPSPVEEAGDTESSDAPSSSATAEL